MDSYVVCRMYVIRWFANLTKFRILKYEFLFSFFLTEKINLLLVQQKNVDQSNSLFLSFEELKVNNNKYLYFKIWNFVKLANHRMTYTRQKSRTFGLGQTNWADKFWGIWGIFGLIISPWFGTVSPLSMFSIIQPLLLQKTKPLYPNSKYLYGFGFGFEFEFVGRKEFGI